ncbi:hypothetical protein SARC_06271 [Sphaeroforma arctica JP610]|uniref:Uncharacterized protein n=1 Tax=Sphaeroforma arctica JP610 TaxID=667725 RepID=A0A0L0FX48_9EUKA|nr:hypothetical protein SARC_06271 [Sphaeroforma arctica JP610]KNC81407.1 hypothetical protein SARC_06271 [Sphaeroforma arctica JP610]|eukprot:XP_014155309.1 hypothetical protein SARC_06271 [Sphaeroforma arctica JP610]
MVQQADRVIPSRDESEVQGSRVKGLLVSKRTSNDCINSYNDLVQQVDRVNPSRGGSAVQGSGVEDYTVSKSTSNDCTYFYNDMVQQIDSLTQGSVLATSPSQIPTDTSRPLARATTDTPLARTHSNRRIRDASIHSLERSDSFVKITLDDDHERTSTVADVYAGLCRSQSNTVRQSTFARGSGIALPASSLRPELGPEPASHTKQSRSSSLYRTGSDSLSPAMPRALSSGDMCPVGIYAFRLVHCRK